MARRRTKGIRQGNVQFLSNTAKDGSGTSLFPLLDSDGHVQVDVLSGGGGGTLVTDGEVINAANTGQIVLGHDGSNYQVVATDASGHVQVDVLSGGGAGTQYTEGDVDATITGTAFMWEDAADTLRAVSAAKPLPVDLGANNDVTLATLPDTAASDLAAINTSTDGIEALLTTIDTDTSSMSTDLTTIAGAIKAEDSVHSSTDTGIMMLGVRNDTLASLADTDGDYAPPQFDADGALYSSTKSTEDSNNTTTTPLGIGGVFTGTGTETLNYSSITVVCFADQDSAASGLVLQWSVDNSNWTDHTAEYTYSASTDFSIGASVRARYFRVKYTNGGTGQSAFRLYTFLHPYQTDTNIRPLSYSISDNDSGPMTRSILAAKKPDTTYTNIDATAGGNLKTSLEEISGGLDIGAGNAGSETQRVSISTDDVNLAAINTNIGTIDTDTGNIAAGYATEGSSLGSGVLLQGDDGTDRKNINVDATTGDVQVDITHTVTVDGSGVTQPISAASLPLPTGASTAANQTTIIGHVDGIEALLTTIDADTSSMNTDLGTIAGAVAGTEMQVDVVAALPAGDNNIGNVDIASSVALDVSAATVSTESDGTALSNNQVTVDTTVGGVTILAASAGRQGVSITNQGAIDCYIGTGTVSTSNGYLLKAGESIPLPTDSEVKGITASSSTTVGYLAFA